MTARDAGVRATIRAAVGQCRHAPVGRRVLAVEAERRIGIEETVGQETDVERAPEMSEHRSQPLCIDDAARQIAEFVAYPCELAAQTCRRGSRWRQSALAIRGSVHCTWLRFTYCWSANSLIDYTGLHTRAVVCWSDSICHLTSRAWRVISQQRAGDLPAGLLWNCGHTPTGAGTNITTRIGPGLQLSTLTASAP